MRERFMMPNDETQRSPPETPDDCIRCFAIVLNRLTAQWGGGWRAGIG